MPPSGKKLGQISALINLVLEPSLVETRDCFYSLYWLPDNSFHFLRFGLTGIAEVDFMMFASRLVAMTFDIVVKSANSWAFRRIGTNMQYLS